MAYTDAACKANPGKASIAVILKDENGNLLENFSQQISYSTSNQAEYLAVLKALELALKYSRDEICVFTDSKLLINQLNGFYRIRKKELLEIIKQIKITELLFKKVKYIKTKDKAHKLAKKAI